METMHFIEQIDGRRKTGANDKQTRRMNRLKV